MKRNYIYRIVLVGILIGMSVVLSFFNPLIPIAGIPGMRISVSSYVSVLPSFLFGPVYGGIAMGLTDILSYFLVRPEGGFMIQLTLTAVLKGVLLGLLFSYIKSKNLKWFDYIKVLICLLPVNLLITTINTKLIMMLYSIDKAFMVYYIPRLVEELINIVIQSYIVKFLLKIADKRMKDVY